MGFWDLFSNAKRVLFNKRTDWNTTMNLNESIGGCRVPVSKDDDLLAIPVFGIDASCAGRDILAGLRCHIADATISNSYASVFGSPAASGMTDASAGLAVNARKMLFNGTIWTGSAPLGFSESMTANAAGSTAIKTSAAGKKLRIRFIDIVVNGGCTLAAAGMEIIQILDVASVIWAGTVRINNAVQTVEYANYTIDFGETGYVQAAANTALNVSLGTVLASGYITVSVRGWEETG